MVPGLYNLASVGTRPILRTGAIITNSPGLTQKSKYEAIQRMEKQAKDTYNPITNPIPKMTQNPYLLREMQKRSIK